MEALNDLRQDLDTLDAQLAALYRRRMDVAARIAAVKREQGLPVLQPEREREIRARLAELAAPALQPGMQAWFEALRAASRDWQESSPAPGASLRCGLLGEHLRHSYSPEIHAMLGAYSYDLFEIPPEGLADFLHGAAWDGLNVTIPYKRAVVPFCAALSPMAKQTGSVNTLVRRADGTLYGANTDAGGFRLLLKRGGGIAPGEKALVLGSGGASQTVQAVLRAQGAEVVVISRRGPVTYDMIEQHADARLVVNATPVGMYPENGVSPLDLRRVPQCRCVLDLVYNPARTALLQQAERLGLRAENGLSMLAEQARCAAGLCLQRPVDPAHPAAVGRARIETAGGVGGGNLPPRRQRERVAVAEQKGVFTVAEPDFTVEIHIAVEVGQCRKGRVDGFRIEVVRHHPVVVFRVGRAETVVAQIVPRVADRAARPRENQFGK